MGILNKKSRLLIFTGEGKGKTTAALGMALRASGHGMRTLMIQFIKANPSTGECNALKRLPEVEMIQMGLGFVPSPSDPSFTEHAQAAEDALQFAEKAIRSGLYDLVILDELCTAISKGLLDEDRVVESLNKGNSNIYIVITGRGASDRLISIADTATKMDCLKHGLQKGRKAQMGVEY